MTHPTPFDDTTEFRLLPGLEDPAREPELFASACVRTVCGLTPREVQVLRWLSCGKTDSEIGALLAISRRTVQKHLEHMYVKLGVETRTAAVMRALSIAAAPRRGGAART